ncbi:rotatin-like [Liolophura sinensis]|uniref:rotatin-like n=1 Tax=Liolophura sinensis TaxID=3198878 RepID=UPI00315800BD
MTSNLRQDVDFSALFRKLGHDLEEIRVRSLNNILSKLDHKLICEADLVHERHLLIRLLEWFNFQPCPMQTQVLELLLKLAKHSGAAEILLNVGGLDFLTKLRQNCDVGDQPLVDQLMECLLRLPNQSVNEDHTPECWYKGSNSQDVPITTEHVQASHGHISQRIPSHQAARQTRVQYPEDHVSPRGLSLNTEYIGTESQDAPIGYFTPAGQRETPHSPTDSITALPLCFKVTTFPWLPLTSTDRHVLSSTNSSLQSRDGALLTSACEFLSDVVFQDFPAEAFLQRPAIVKSLLSLLSAAPAEFENLPSQSTQTLIDLTQSLRSRILFYQDPALYTPKQDFSSPAGSSFTSQNSSSQSVHSLEPRPPAIGHSGRRHRGDGRDQDSSTNGSMSRSGSQSPLMGDPQQTDAEDTNALQLMQMTVPQFSVLTLDTSLPLLKLNSRSGVPRSLQLVTASLSLLRESLTSHIWEDNTPAAREIVEKLEEIFEKFAELLHFHHHSNWSHGSQVVSTHRRKEIKHHRVIYLGLSTCLVQLLNVIVPVDQADSCLPEVLIGCLNDLVYDESLSHSYPHIRETALNYLQVVSSRKYQLYTHAVNVCKSTESTCQFLMEFDAKATTHLQDYLPLALSCLESLPYHRHSVLITNFVQLASLICTHEAGLEYQSLLLKLLSHRVEELRVKTYQACYQIIRTSLCIDAAADPHSRASDNVSFLLDTQILQELIYFGLSDSNKEVHDLSHLMLTHILQSELLMSHDQWTHLLSSILPVLPVLQGYIEIQTSLGSCLMGLIEPEMKDKDTRLPPLERFRGCLRLMLSADTKCRAESLKRLAWFISHEEDSHLKLPTFADLDVSNITNLFIMKSPRTVDEDDSGQTVFKVDGMQKVYGIFVSETVEPSVRKSAIEQLSIILQDSCLHSSFVKDGGVEKVLEVLHRGVQKATEGSQENFTVYVPACLKILRHIAHHSSSLRHRLAHDSALYHSLLRGALLYHGDDLICYEASHLLTLLLFDEVAMFQIRSSSSSSTSSSAHKQHKAFSLPAAVVKRYRLPFKTAVHHESSRHQGAPISESDPLTSGMPAEMLRITWNVAWHCGISKLLECLNHPSHYNKSSKDFPSHLHLSPTDISILRVSHLQTSLQQGLYDISNATSHADVTSALNTLTSYIATPTGQGSRRVLHQLCWQDVIGRFLRTVPSSTSDESLLFEVLRFVSMLLKSSSHPPGNVLVWLVETLYQATGPLIGLLSRSTSLGEGDVNVRRQLDKQLLTFITTYSRQLPANFLSKPDIGQLRGNLSHKLLLRLNVAEAPHFYNLAMLEGTLHCLMTITARPGWSEECTELESSTLCSQLLNSLLEVVSAFHIGRGGTSMSYMGKGVTKAATLCLRQLAYEMATSTEDKDWPQNWLYSRQGTDAVGEPGLNWMLTLWAYRDPEVRAAGLGIAVALTSTESGRIMLTSNCKHIPGGIWGAAFSILLDQSECSVVRQQAALLLVNLTSQTMPGGGTLVNEEGSQTAWQGPVVTDTEYDLSLVGLPALLALLHHSQFYQEMTVLCENFFPQPAIHPVSVASSPPGSHATSQTTITTLESSVMSRPTVTSVGIGGQTAHQSNRQLYTSTPTQSLISNSHLGRQQGRVGTRSVATPVTATTQSTPSMFGAQMGGEMSVSSLPDSQESGEYQGVTTPSLISAVCLLLRNLMLLAPQDTLNSLKHEAILHSLFSLIDVDLLEAYCAEMSQEGQVMRYELVFADLLDMITSLAKLSKLLLGSSRPELCQEAILQQNGLRSLTSLCGLRFQGQPSTHRQSDQLLQSVYTLLTYILNSSLTTLKNVAAVVVKENWQVVMDNAQIILKSRGKGNKDLYTSCLQFLAVLFSTEAKSTSNSQISWKVLLDKGAPDDTSRKCTGSVLCECLLEAYESVALTSTPGANSKEKTMVNNAFRLLLALSHAAKSTALDGGLVESLVNQVRQLNAKLNLDPPSLAKQGSKKKEDPISLEIISMFDLLKNFMYGDMKVKIAAHHSGLGNLVHQLWSWCQLTSALMTSALSLLTTFTAQCPDAASSLAFTNPSTVNISPPSNKGPLSSNSLVHALIKYAQNDLEKASVQRHSAVFKLLAVLCLSTECRNILWKSNFLNEFSKLNPKKQKSKSKQNVEGLWLDLLLNLSFSTEGQQMICKINDSIVLLLEFGETQGACREKALLILRNLCFHTSNKPKLLANDQVIPFLVQSLWRESSKERAMASSGLYALAFNNQKAKNALKNVNIVVKAQEVLGSCTKTKEGKALYSQSVKNLHNLIATVSD